jgi:hypothetical protein
MSRTGKIMLLLSITVLALVSCRSNQAAKKMGYCFDAAFNADSNRLYITAGQAGLHILDVDEQGHLNYVSTHYAGGYYRNIKMQAGRAYIAGTDLPGLLALDNADDPPLSKWSRSGHGMGLSVEANTLYLVDADSGLYIFDVSNPESPRQLAQFESLEQAWDVWVHQGSAYVADKNKGMVVIDVTAPAEPRQIGFVTWDERDPMAEIIRGEGHFAYIAAGKHGLVAIDVSDPTHPVVAAVYDPGVDSFGEGLFVRDNIVYLAIGDKKNRQENGLHILDVSNPYSPAVISKLPFEDWVEGVFVAGDYAFVANTYSGVRSIDIRDLGNPQLVDHFASVP